MQVLFWRSPEFNTCLHFYGLSRSPAQKQTWTLRSLWGWSWAAWWLLPWWKFSFFPGEDCSSRGSPCTRASASNHASLSQTSLWLNFIYLLFIAQAKTRVSRTTKSYKVVISGLTSISHSWIWFIIRRILLKKNMQTTQRFSQRKKRRSNQTKRS